MSTQNPGGLKLKYSINNLDENAPRLAAGATLQSSGALLRASGESSTEILISVNPCQIELLSSIDVAPYVRL